VSFTRAAGHRAQGPRPMRPRTRSWPSDRRRAGCPTWWSSRHFDAADIELAVIPTPASPSGRVVADPAGDLRGGAVPRGRTRRFQLVGGERSKSNESPILFAKDRHIAEHRRRRLRQRRRDPGLVIRTWCYLTGTPAFPLCTTSSLFLDPTPPLYSFTPCFSGGHEPSIRGTPPHRRRPSF